MDNNRMLAAAGKEPINLKSVMIGNGITDSCGCSGLQDGDGADVLQSRLRSPTTPS